MAALAIHGGSAAVRGVIPKWPMGGAAEIANLQEVVHSGEWWRNSGTQVKAFEQEFAAFHGCGFGAAVTNGTQAIELGLRALGIGPGDEVIVPSLTYIATASAVFSVGATPIPADVDPRTWCLDAADVARKLTPSSRAVIPVHFAGQVADMDALAAVCALAGLHIVEDAAHAHGARWRGRRPGEFGACATFSFQNFKLMTAGEGGILITRNEDLHREAILLSNCGREPGVVTYDHQRSGWNNRCSEFQAAVLRAQLGRLEELGDRRREGGLRLDDALAGHPWATPQWTDPRSELHARYMYVLTLDPELTRAVGRDTVLAALNAEGVPAKPIYPAQESTPFFREAIARQNRRQPARAECPHSWDIGERGVWLHHAALLADADIQDQIAEAFWKLSDHAGELDGQRRAS